MEKWIRLIVQTMIFAVVFGVVQYLMGESVDKAFKIALASIPTYFVVVYLFGLLPQNKK